MNTNAMSAVLAAAVAAVSGTAAAEGKYLAGDFHNHTTCSDGSTSVQTLTRKSLEYLDWFVQVGHSGRGIRDCRVSDFLGLVRDSSLSRGLWVNTLPNGVDDIKGDLAFQNTRDGVAVPSMWRWQALQEFNLVSIVEEREKPQNEGKVAFLGLEWVVPGHEHSSNILSTGQYDELPNSDALAQFEYCFASNSDDTSGGGGQGWTCELSKEANDKLIELFGSRPEEGVADYNSTLVNGIAPNVGGNHVKSSAAMLWKQENFPGDSVAVPAHLERQGAFVSGSNRGYNIEHVRDWHSLAPGVAFGMESQPGHQAASNRGGYSAGRPTAGLFTFGGTGCYGGAEAGKPGMDFDGNPLNQADFGPGNKYDLLSPNTSPERVTLCRPGVRTMWDAMLSEGRRYWFFASSDWHNRGAFGPLDFESNNDFWPGEYQQNFTWIDGEFSQDPARDVIDGLRSGNSFTVMGQLISGDFTFKACTASECAVMGETLAARKGEEVTVTLVVTDPDGVNNSKYAFNNPALLQIGKKVPVNQPELAQVDLIQGAVNKIIEPTDPEYYNPLAPATTRIVKTWADFGKHSSYRKHRGNHWEKSEGNTYELTYRFVAKEDTYVRARGSNLPAGTPNMRDMYGNPLSDHLADNILCDDPACPPHVDGKLDADVQAWSDISFHANPIFIEVDGEQSAEGPCASLCSNPKELTFPGSSFKSGALGTGEVCLETQAVISYGTCNDFAGKRTLSVNGEAQVCNSSNWTAPEPRNGGYCLQAPKGGKPWAWFSVW